MKKFLVLLLVLCMVCPLALADELHLKNLTPERYPIAENGKLVVWAGQDGNHQDYPLNPQTAAMKALTGIDVEWITTPGAWSDWNQKYLLSLASGQYPDIYLFGTSTGEILNYAGDIFIPLDEYIENTHWIKKYLDEDPILRETLTAPDGHIYCLWGNMPTTGDRNENTAPYKLWIYKPWLEKSGMDMPETVDEYREYLRFVRDNDMNGNGDATDELPMFGSHAFAQDGSDPTWAVMQAFTVFPSNFLWADEDHNVTCLAVTDEFREGLKYLNGMYDEGLIPEDIYALTLNEFRDVVNVTKPEDMLVASAGAAYWMRFVTVSIYGERAYDDFTFMPVLKRTADAQPQTFGKTNSYGMKYTITTACKDPQMALNWIDAGMDPEINRADMLGNEGDYWTRVSEEGALPIVTMAVEGKELKDGGSVNLHCYGGSVYPRIPNSYFDLALKEGSTDWKKETIQREANATYLAACKFNNFPTVVWSTDQDLITEQAELSTAITGAIKTAYAEFVLGRRDIEDDAVWEAFKAELENLGLSRYLEVQKLYNFGE